MACHALSAGAEPSSTTLTTAAWQALPGGSQSGSQNGSQSGDKDTSLVNAQTITLPFTLPERPALQRLVFELPIARPSVPMVLLVPRTANAVWVEWNQHLVAQTGQAGSVDYSGALANNYSGDSHQPLRVDLPLALWENSAQRLSITLAARHLQPITFLPPELGLAEAIEPRYQAALLRNLEVPWAIAGALLALGAAALLISALARDRLYLLLAGTALASAAHMVMLWLPSPLGQGSAEVLWPLIYRMCLPAFLVFCTLFWFDALGVTSKFARRAIWLLLPVQLVLLLGLFLADSSSLLFQRLSSAVNTLAALGFAGFVGYTAFGKPTVARALLFIALCGIFLALVFGLTKHGLLDIRAFLFPWMAYAMLAFCALQTWELLEGYNRALRSTRVNARYFETQLQTKRAELDASFGALRDAASAEAVEQERRRIMREIHDGIGSSLVNAMSLVQRDDPAQAPIGVALQDSMNELRMAIDALQPHEADLLTALGTLRARVQPALKAAGIDLKWDVQPVPEISRLTPENTLHLYRFVQEAFANVIKHSHATTVTVRTDFDERRDMVSVMIDDNGKGWRPHRSGERRGGGSETLRLRAQKLGGWARITPLAPGTRVALSFPRSASAAAAVMAHAEFSPSLPRHD